MTRRAVALAHLNRHTSTDRDLADHPSFLGSPPSGELVERFGRHDGDHTDPAVEHVVRASSALRPGPGRSGS